MSGEDILRSIRDDQYAKVMIERDVLTCTSVRYQTPWLCQLEKSVKDKTNLEKPITVVVDGRSEYRLGQVFNAVCYWEPQGEMLYFIREVQEL